MLKNFLLTNTSEIEGYGIEGLSEYTVVSDLDNFAMGRGGGVKESDPCTGQTAIMPFKLLTNLTAMLFEPTSARNEVKLTSE